MPAYAWQPREQPATQPHEYIRGGTTKSWPVSSRLRPGAAAASAPLHQCGPASVAARAPERDPDGAARFPQASLDPTVTRAAWTVSQQGLTRPFTLPHEPAAAAAVAGVGQSGWPQDTRPGAVAVRTWRHAALHARGRQLAQHGGVDRARAQAPGARRSASA